MARKDSTFYISDLGTDDNNGVVYTHDLSGISTTATLLKDNLARPKGVAVSGNDVLVVEALTSQILSIDQNGADTVLVDNLDIHYLLGKNKLLYTSSYRGRK